MEVRNAWTREGEECMDKVEAVVHSNHNLRIKMAKSHLTLSFLLMCNLLNRPRNSLSCGLLLMESITSTDCGIMEESNLSCNGKQDMVIVSIFIFTPHTP